MHGGPRLDKCSSEIIEAIARGEQEIAVLISVHGGSVYQTVAGRHVAQLNESGSDAFLGAEPSGGYSGYLSAEEIAKLSSEVWVTEIHALEE